MRTNSAESGEQRSHSVRVVCRRTGLTPATLRAWERRYRAVEPRRSGGHQRLYSDSDVARLRLLHRLSVSGHRIGRIARLTAEQLEALIAQEVETPSEPAPLASDAGGNSEWLARELFAATKRLDAAAVHRLLERAASALGVPALLEDLLRPLFRSIGDGWKAGELQPAHEHLATAQARGLMERALARHPAQPGTPVGVFTTPTGQRHELGALGCALTAAVEGWTAVYLGPDSPAEDIVLAARETKARLVALSMTQDDATGSSRADVLNVARHLPPETMLVVGGAGAGGLTDALTEVGATVLTDLHALTRTLRSAARGGELTSAADSVRSEAR